MEVRVRWLLVSALSVACLPLLNLSAGAVTCDMTAYQSKSGLVASVADGSLTVTWDGDTPGDQVRAVLAVSSGKPVIRELAVHPAGASWATVVKDVSPEFQVVSGMRRITNQQLNPLRAMGNAISQDVIDKEKWEAFWDSPLRVGGSPSAVGPPKEGIGSQPGLPRSASEIRRSVAL